jgi:signal transduction histidine kinase
METSVERTRVRTEKGERKRLLQLKRHIDETLRRLVRDYHHLEELNRALEKKAQWAAQELEQARSQLLSAQRDIESHQNHEAKLLKFLLKGLKSPLNLIEEHIVQLTSHCGGRDGNGSVYSLDQLRGEVHRLWQIVEDLTLMEAIQLGEVHIKRESVDLRKVVNMVLQEHKKVALDQQVGLNDDINEHLPAVLGDREQLRLALNHLVDNAIAHSPMGGTVTIRANGEHLESQVSLDIMDMREDALDEADFKALRGQFPGHRPLDLEIQGFDLELMAAWHIIDMHHGQIEVRSQAGRGTVFTLTLPAETRAETGH